MGKKIILLPINKSQGGFIYKHLYLMDKQQKYPLKDRFKL